MTTEFKSEIPSSKALVALVVEAIQTHGGSASARQVDQYILTKLRLDKDVANCPHKQGESRTELQYRSAWARTYAKKQGKVGIDVEGKWVATIVA